MREVFRWSSLALLLGTGCGGAAAGANTTGTAEDGAYPIVLHRPLRAGMKVRVAVEARHVERTTVADGTEVAEMSRDDGVRLMGIVTIEEADGEGRALTAALDVGELVDLAHGDTIIEAGRLVRVSRVDEERVFTWGSGEPLPDDAAAAIALAFPLRRPGSPLGDELFGTDAPKRVGDTWSIDRAFGEEELAENGALLTSEGTTTGEVTLAGLEECDAILDCLRVEATLVADATTWDAYGDTADFTQGHVELGVTVLIPQDDDSFLRGESSSLTAVFDASFATPEGALDRHIEVRRTRTALYQDVVVSPED